MTLDKNWIHTSPSIVDDALITSYGREKEGFAPNTEPIAIKLNASFDDKAKQHDDLGQYGPVYWNEPEAIQKPTQDELPDSHQVLRKSSYFPATEPTRPLGHLRGASNEHFTIVNGTAASTSKLRTAELVYPGLASQGYSRTLEHVAPTFNQSKSRQIENQPKITVGNPRRKLPDLDTLIRRNCETRDNGCGNLDGSDQKGSKPYPDNASVMEIFNSRQASRRAPSIYRQPSKHVAATSDESKKHSENCLEMKDEKPSKKRSDLDASRRAYEAHRNVAKKINAGFNREELKSPKSAVETCANSASSTPTEVNIDEETCNATDARSVRHRSQADDSRGCSTDAARNFANFGTARDIRAEMLRRAPSNNERAKLQKAKSDHELNWDAAAKEAQDTLDQSKAKTRRLLTGNYVWDFPEEFSASWSTTNASSKSTLFPKKGSDGGQLAAAPYDAVDMEREEAEPSSMDGSFPSEEVKIEPSLDRQPTRRETRTAVTKPEKHESTEGAYAKVARRPETSLIHECGEESRVALPEHKTAETDASAKVVDQPVSFRILAHDAATGTISMAETTSGINDTQAWTSPAAILPRLSSPSKFVAHIDRLHGQGYEVVAGGGDVLILSKVRTGTPGSPLKRRESCQAVNPIDLMGKPVTGNFASPTGFVNYDTMTEGDDSKPSPPFRTSSDGTVG